MKKTWVFGIALALGAIGGPVVPASAQYSGVPYSSGALAPSGYAVPENYSAQRVTYQQVASPAFRAGPVAQLPQYAQPMVAQSQFAQQQYAQQQYAQQQYAQQQYAQQQAQQQYAQPQAQMGGAQPYSQVPSMTQATMVAYPQELIPAPGVNANQAPEAGWVGPNAGQYQAQGGSHSVLQAAPQVPMQQPTPAPVNGNMAMPYQQGNVVTQGPGCGDGGYGVSTYGAMLAPTATAPMVSGYAGGCGGGYAGGCGAPVYAGPVYASPILPGTGFAAGFLGNRGSLPGRAFFAGGSALLFRRVDDHNVALSYNTAMPSENSLGTRDARQDHLNGFEVFGGRYFNCGRNAIMASYWGLFPEDQMARIDAPAAPSTYRSRYHFNGIDMPTQSVYDWYDGAMSHRIVRGSDYNNVEVNLLGFAVGGASRTWTTYGGGCGGLGARFGAVGYGLGNVGYGGGGACGGGYDACGSACGSSCGTGCGSCGPAVASCAPACGGDCTSCGAGCAAFTGPCGLTPNMCGSRLNWTWLAGFRWFQFADRLEYSASDLDTVYNGGADDLYYRNNVRNDLYGFQLGGAGTYCLGQRFNVYALSKAGIFNNHSTLSTRINRTGGPDATINSTNIFNGDAYMVEASQNNAAVLGELGTGIGARITRGWSANVGYRVIGVSGVATAVNTIPIEMIHLGNVADYNTTSSLILHGVTVGGMYNF